MRCSREIGLCDEAADIMFRIERQSDVIERRYNKLIEQKTVFAGRAAARIRYIMQEGADGDDRTAVFVSLLVGAVASLGIFHPLALGMASGVGSGSMMTAAAGTLGQIYPEYAEDIIVMGGASDMLTGVTGIYMGTFVGLPLTRKLYAYLEPRLGRRAKRG